MKHATPAILVLAAAFAVVATPAHALLRHVQIVPSGTSLITQMAALDGTVDVLQDQDNTQGWGMSPNGPTTTTLQIELTDESDKNAVGVYNTGNPGDRFEILPANAGNDWYAIATFTAPGTLKVNLFDNNGNPVGLSPTYTGVAINSFGYYLENKGTPGNIGYTEDDQNGGAVRALAYRAAAAIDAWWVCFEDAAETPADTDYDDAILFVETVLPTPVTKTTWASVKARFR